MSTRETSGYDVTSVERATWLSAAVAVLGAWLVVESLLFDLVAAQFWNDVVVGALLIALGGYNYYRRSEEAVGNVAIASMVAVLGLWLAVSPFVLGPGAGATETAGALAFWNDVVVGLIALAMGAYSVYAAREGTGSPIPIGR